MKKIASFTINHDSLTRGMYVSRVDGDVVTYDIRMKTPNNPENDYLEDNALHTFEHLFATYVRNTPYSDEVVYVGPMGCRTGFYFLTRDTLPKETAIRLVQETISYVLQFVGKIIAAFPPFAAGTADGLGAAAALPFSAEAYCSGAA